MRLPFRTIWYFLLAQNFVLLIGIIIIFSLFYFFSDVFSESKFVILFLLLLLIFPLFIILWTFISLIIEWRNTEYFFEKGRIIIKSKWFILADRIITVEDIERFDLIQDDILARLCGLEIIGIRTKAQAEEETLLRKPLSQVPRSKIVEVVTSVLIGGKLSSVLKNPGLRMSRKGLPYYDIFLPMGKMQARKIKDFLDFKMEHSILEAKT